MVMSGETINLLGDTALVQKTLRSGQTVRFDGNIVVQGDVNPGAEIIAAGHVLVMGALRGVVHAGAKGDESATVTALAFSPTQIRIASYITRPPDGLVVQTAPSIPDTYCPETAFLRDGEVVIEKYIVSK